MTTLRMILMLNPANHRPQEFLRDFEIVNRATPNRSMDFHVIRLPAQKLERLRSDGQDFATVFMKRQNGWLIQHHAFRRRIYDSVYGAQVNGQILAEETSENMHCKLPRL